MSDDLSDIPERPWPNPYLQVAAIVGHTTASSTRIWVRTNKEGSFRLFVFCLSAPANAAFAQSLKARAVTSGVLPGEVAINQLASGGITAFDFAVTNATDTTHVVDIDGLQALTQYNYLLWDTSTDAPVLGHIRPHFFRTQPEIDTSGAVPPTSFGFFSCHMPYKKTLFGRTKAVNEEMWDYLNSMLNRHFKKELRFIIAGGDQVYSDGVETLDIWKLLNKRMKKKQGKLTPDVETMVSWYRDIYRGYWGLPALREVFSCFPTYMIWDDHEIGDGWGSYHFDADRPKKDELNELLPDLKDRGLSHQDGMELLQRMFTAASRVYREYQHSHNPDMSTASPAFPNGSLDYHFSFPKGAVYVQDGRGHRDFNRKKFRILGEEQFQRFAGWLDALDPATTPYVFVVSAVPMVHLSHLVVDQGESKAADLANLTDDLRDGWEHKAHKTENKAVLKALFKAAKKGHRVCILSGDVHVAAVFRLTDPDSGSQIYQLTSSAITYNLPLPMGWLLGKAVPDDGVTRDGYHFKRLARYTDSNFSLVRVDPDKDTIDFQLYGEQVTGHPDGGGDIPNSHSIAKIELSFPK